ncbi:class I SAM-dependent methyltransferase [Streptomyces alkaliterrae]|uniref:Class I SAM-dependent methyltransferase n=1 Tax=Streptomyces alkaliterrae TaxID=2213162 RepID=A0A5P0YVD5_9ACTN|nr:class I SAM-dependent methyltransferase [Streptomyces alkaliterrae]MBB1252318.1 class I SAM-dependent methyltransferase [Streptomyces alkaliterrae]MBB1258119.1 class I SAM-dependent methyltransferase [Streptomyces alkaliterrae]MQS04254.1 methyltransferase domain-containing protein [Streptomyces alkaliterrae]
MASAEKTAEMHDLFNRTARSYDQSGVEFFGPIGRRLVEFSGITAGKTVLDVGSGRGAALFPAAEAVGENGEVVGVDISEEMVGYALEDVRARGLKQVSVSVMNGQRPEFENARFDAVIGSCSLFIWVKGADDVTPYLRLLRAGGTFATAAPSFFSTVRGKWALFPEAVNDLLMPYMLQSLKQNGAYDSQFAEAGANWLASEESIGKTLTEAGFIDVAVEEKDLPVVVKSGQEWVEFTYTTGMRGMWERIEENERAELVAEVSRRLDGLRGGSGDITVPVPIVYIRARAPQA